MEPPPGSHPIKARSLSVDKIWVFRQYTPFQDAIVSDQRCVLEDTLANSSHGTYNLVSDASVHISQRKAAGAWRLLESDTAIRRVNMPLQHQHLSHSYRHELEIFYMH